MPECINLAELPKGVTYENTYGAWLSIFRRVAESECKPELRNAPPCWAPLLYYLGANVLTLQEHFAEDKLTDFIPLDLKAAESRNMLRELVEIYSVFRPELVDALYKSDVEWRTIGRRQGPPKQAFNVTSNNSFFRPEVLRYFTEVLPSYRQVKKKCVIVPCAADKPYPAPLHRAVREYVGNDYEMIIASGVLGLVPESLWGISPEYDSGLPYEWRIMQVVREFFATHRYERILVYSEYNSLAIKRGLAEAGISLPTVVYLFQPRYYTAYEDLLDQKHLIRLREAAK